MGFQKPNFVTKIEKCLSYNYDFSKPEYEYTQKHCIYKMFYVIDGQGLILMEILFKPFKLVISRSKANTLWVIFNF